MTYFDMRSDRSNLKGRVARLGVTKRRVLAASALSHALAVVGASVDAATTNSLETILPVLWSGVGDPVALQAALSERFPDEDSFPSASDRCYVWAAWKALDLIARPASASALAVLDQCYQAVSNHYVPVTTSAMEDEYCRLEMQSTHCESEMDFQIACVAVLEEAKRVPGNYRSMLRAVG